jgi:hypothetical protein
MITKLIFVKCFLLLFIGWKSIVELALGLCFLTDLAWMRTTWLFLLVALKAFRSIALHSRCHLSVTRTTRPVLAQAFAAKSSPLLKLFMELALVKFLVLFGILCLLSIYFKNSLQAPFSEGVLRLRENRKNVKISSK